MIWIVLHPESGTLVHPPGSLDGSTQVRLVSLEGRDAPSHYPLDAVTVREEDLLDHLRDGPEEDVVVITRTGRLDPLPGLLRELGNGSELSMTVPGNGNGSRPSLLSRILFDGLREVEDSRPDLVAFRRGLLKGVDFSGDLPSLEELLILANPSGVSQVSYDGSRQDRGKGGGPVETWRLGWRSGEFLRFFKFCAVGGLGTVVNLLVLFLLASMGLFYLAAGIVAIEAGLLVNFFSNKVWTFKDKRVSGVKAVLRALGKDHMVRLGGVLLNIAVLWTLTDLAGIYYMISQVLGIAASTLWNYGGNKLWTWE
ncbi:MAG: GtrA family protein [Thermoplasmatota archaeon]